MGGQREFFQLTEQALVTPLSTIGLFAILGALVWAFVFVARSEK